MRNTPKISKKSVGKKKIFCEKSEKHFFSSRIGPSPKMKEMKKKLYLDFMHLQQAYDRTKREALWQVLMIYGINGRLLNGIKSVYVDNEDCVRMNEV